MPTLLAESFTASLAKLANDEQKRAKLTAFDLQTAPDAPGLSFHRIEASKDPNFWSVRVSRDIRIIVHKTGASLMLCYVGHHDDAYRWAERRRIEAHPRTGAIQIVEVRERVEEIAPAPRYDGRPAEAIGDPVAATAEPRPPGPPLFAALTHADLLSVGVPTDWLADVAAADEDRFLALSQHLPAEAGEALLEYAATGRLAVAAPAAADPLDHPDTQRRFRVMEGVEELKAALDAPFERWTVFLHPAQRGVVERRFNGPARVVGSAGTGKTVVALHRVVQIIKADPDARVLLTTFSEPLARSLTAKLALLTADHPSLRERVTIGSFDGVATDLLTLATGRRPHVADTATVRSLLEKADRFAGGRHSEPFLISEWTHVVDAWQIGRLDDYAEVPRMGRKNRLGARQREQLWGVFDRVRRDLAERGLTTTAGIFAAATAHHAARADKPFSHVVVDEAQDLGVAELRFLAAITPAAPDALFFAGDIGQRIFQQPFSWKGLGVDVRGRSVTLKVNYRTSHQIRRAADRLLPQSVRDVDGVEDQRLGTVSVFDGPEPQIALAADEAEEIATVAVFLRSALAEGIAPAEIGVFVRSDGEIARARAAAAAAGLPVRALHEAVGTGAALLGPMHLAKGLEFRAVALMACDEGVLPLAERIADVADAFELDEVVATERQLLYVAATRARDRLLVTGLTPGSEFLEDLFGGGSESRLHPDLRV